VSRGGHARVVFFLSADAFGVLPAVSRLTPAQTQYHFLSGFTAKLAGTERGVDQPAPTFSACFGAAFLTLHPTNYARELARKMESAGARAYLINTGWNGSGKRISIAATRAIINAVLAGEFERADTVTLPRFHLEIPLSLPGVDAAILDPRATYKNPDEWDARAKRLATLFIDNFKNYQDHAAGKQLAKAGPVAD